jgi:hypothetical protein
MRLNLKRLAVGMACLVFGTVAMVLQTTTSAADVDMYYRTPLPTDDAKRLIDSDIKTLNELLSANPIPKNTNSTIKAQALMIAVQAQSAMANAKGDEAIQWATIRDSAIKVAETAEKERAGKKKVYADSMALAKELSLKMKPDASAKTMSLKLHENKNAKFSLDNLMHLFAAKDPTGGLNYEKMIEDAAKGGVKNLGEAKDLAHRITKIADLVDAWAPEKDDGPKKTVKKWKDTNDQMRKSAEDIIKAASAKGGEKAAGDAMKKLLKSCVDCHDVFRTDS